MKFYPGLATGLSFSGGKGSTALLAMILEGDIPRPKNFFVCNSDPGMENSATYAFVDAYEKECNAHKIPFLRVRRNLYAEIMALKASGATRFDLPPFWTKNRVTGKIGRLPQKCTGAYKIAPMDRAIRAWMADWIGVPRYSRRIGEGTLVKYIGFSQNEWTRIKESKQKYVDLQYPLVDRRITDADIFAFFIKKGRTLPPRSVCNACYANDVAYLKAMHDERPKDWAQAVAVDEEIRDLQCVGIKDECYVSSTCVPLRVMALMDFKNLSDQELVSCHSGHCFV